MLFRSNQDVFLMVDLAVGRISKEISQAQISKIYLAAAEISSPIYLEAADKLDGAKILVRRLRFLLEIQSLAPKLLCA